MKRSPKRDYTDLKKIIYLIAAVCCIVFLIFSLIYRKFADNNVWINAIVVIVLVGYIYDFLSEKFKK